MEKQLIIDKIKFYNFPISGDSFVVAVIDIEQPNTLENEKQNFTLFFICVFFVVFN